MLAKSKQYAHNPTMALPHSDFASRTLETLEKYRMLEASDRVLVGVSGGADSVSLLLVLKELGYELGVAHLNHSLRGTESEEDERFVADLASGLDLPFFSRRITIRPADGNVEAIGRTARKEYFASLCQSEGFQKVALAHTRDDRIETFLLHLLRGAGMEGIVSMNPVSGNIVRPLIETSHEEIQRFLAGSMQAWRVDSSNMDLAFARNRLRHDVIPQLERHFNPKLRETVSRTIELLQNEEGWMQEITSNWVEDHLTESDGAVSVDAVALRGTSVALCRRAIRMLLRRAGSDLHDITFDRIEAVRGLLEDGKSGKTVQIPGRFVAERNFGQLTVRQLLTEVHDFDYVLPIPGTVHIPELEMTFRAGIADSTADGTMVRHTSDSGKRVFVDGGRLGPCVKIRAWKPGDYYKPVGWPGGKLKKFFQRTRIPRNQRSRWPVIVSESTVIWVASFPVSRDFAPNGRSQKIVTLEVL